MRSNRPDVRNPLLTLPEAVEMSNLPPEARDALQRALVAFSKACRGKAELCWRTHKPPMAAYWKAWAVNARHAALLLQSAPPAQPLGKP